MTHMSLLGKLRRKSPAPRVPVAPHPWTDPVENFATRLAADPTSEQLRLESGDWAWLGVSLEPEETQWALCPAHIYQANADGIWYLTDRAFYLGYAGTAKRYPLPQVLGMVVDPADYAEVGLGVRFDEADVVTHLRILDAAAFASFYPSAARLLLATESTAVVRHQRWEQARTDLIADARTDFAGHPAFAGYAEPERWLAHAVVFADPSDGPPDPELWVLTPDGVLRRGRDGFRPYPWAALSARRDPAAQHRFTVIADGPQGRRAVVHLEPMSSPLLGPDDRWWEFFEALLTFTGADHR
jgi:hypothetical protein